MNKPFALGCVSALSLVLAAAACSESFTADPDAGAPTPDASADGNDPKGIVPPPSGTDAGDAAHADVEPPLDDASTDSEAAQDTSVDLPDVSIDVVPDGSACNDV